eukprot:CAMPEP_0204275982 /NCGR_PEP_ID=MMETSP0468-20130131/27095_1 /ASSEMBLY_ACC=CAM_ASM_000383 /TAXON_ID=2969 /ORGANISM="Oxyrrhis marina" /LENGTH=226 /DNA_ID=CAMNT_0051252461 /DNA_START=52 /DNA_END=732 /DNA_ORIENTATION=+
MPEKVFTMPISQPCRALSWACYYEKCPVEEVIIMPGKDTATPEFKKDNPIAKVPRLVDGDLVLGESHAIMHYLGDKHNWKLYPKDTRTRALIHQYFNWHHNNSRNITMGLFAPVVRKDIGIPKPMVDFNIKTIKGSLAVMEQWLQKSDWLCGDLPTVADLSAFCEVGQCTDKQFGLFTANGISLDNYPKLCAWLDRCEKLDGFEKSHAPVMQFVPKVKQMMGKSKL